MANNDLILSCQVKSCNKKLTLTNNFNCQCGNFYCIRHKFSFDHDCKFDYKNKQREILQKNLIKVVSDKVIKI